jgi:hypothetical protein
MVSIVRLLSMILVLTAFGCKRQQSPPPSAPTSSPTQGTAEAVPQGAPPQVLRPADAPPGEAINLDRELRRWILANRRPPKNFEDFAATAGIQIPPPPPGKKYVIDKSMHVILK